MSIVRFLPLLAAALSLSACAAGSPGDAVGRYLAQGSTAEGGVPLASLPSTAGRVVAVRRIAYADGFRQEIVLEGPRAMMGENRITVETLTTSRKGGRGLGGEELKLERPSVDGIAAEMERALPGMAMRISNARERDEDGPIGFATGTTGRLSCVYAWQYLAPSSPMTMIEGLSDTGALPMALRVRLCGERPVEALLAEVRGLRASRPGPGGDEPGFRPKGDALQAAVALTAGPSDAEASPERDARRVRPHRATIALRRTLGAAVHRPRPAIRAGFRRPLQDGEFVSTLSRLPMPSDFSGVTSIALHPSEPVTSRAEVTTDSSLPLPR